MNGDHRALDLPGLWICQGIIQQFNHLGFKMDKEEGNEDKGGLKNREKMG